MFSREKSINAAAPAYVCMGSFSMFLFGGVGQRCRAGEPSLPGLTRQSILSKMQDGRIVPVYDRVKMAP
jgi:hypothetical protein